MIAQEVGLNLDGRIAADPVKFENDWVDFDLFLEFSGNPEDSGDLGGSF